MLERACGGHAEDVRGPGAIRRTEDVDELGRRPHVGGALRTVPAGVVPAGVVPAGVVPG